MGKRLGADRNKLLLTVLERSLIEWTLRAASASTAVQWIGLIGQPSDRDVLAAIANQLNVSTPWQFIIGGATRQESVYNGLQGLPPDATKVLIHDGARCLATPDLFDRCAGALAEHDGLIAAIPVKDTIKVVDADRNIESTPERDRLWAAQTPQGFDVALLKDCHAQGQQLGWEVTDDAALLERCGCPVYIVEGEETNLKITTPIDLAIAELILQRRSVA